MSEWIPVILAVVTPTIAGIGWLVKVRWDRRIAQEAAREAHVKGLQEKVESLLHDAVAREKEFFARAAARIEMDVQLKDLIAANTAALTQFAVLLAKLGGKQ